MDPASPEVCLDALDLGRPEEGVAGQVEGNGFGSQPGLEREREAL